MQEPDRTGLPAGSGPGEKGRALPCNPTRRRIPGRDQDRILPTHQALQEVRFRRAQDGRVPRLGRAHFVILRFRHRAIHVRFVRGLRLHGVLQFEAGHRQSGHRLPGELRQHRASDAPVSMKNQGVAHSGHPSAIAWMRTGAGVPCRHSSHASTGFPEIGSMVPEVWSICREFG